MRSYLALTVVLFTLGVWSQDCGVSESVTIKELSPPRRQVNEVAHDCGPVCESCADANCEAIRCGGGCWCQSGHLRDSVRSLPHAGACIPMDQCPSGGVSDDEQLESREWRGVNVPGSCWRNSCAEKK
ncbi:hypothetical protein NHJ6243_002180 [Beauveria neobassiana]